MNRILVESVRLMFIDVYLLYKFWVEVLLIVVYLRNWSLMKVVEDKILYEVWLGDRFNVKYLWVFGCIVYVYVFKDECKKLDFKFRKCIFFGYGVEIKGYWFYDVERCKVLYSCDVIFDELSRLIISGEW